MPARTMCALSDGNLGDGVAEVLLVIEVDGREHGHGRAPHRGGVVAAAEADLEDRDVHPLAGEVVERQRGGRLEHAGVQARHQRAERLHAVDHRVLGDRLAVHANALAERDEMGRGVETHAPAVGLEHRGQHGGHRALAVGAADLGDREALLGVAQRLEQRLDAVQAGAHPRVLAAAQGEEPRQRLGVGHAVGVG